MLVAIAAVANAGDVPVHDLRVVSHELPAELEAAGVVGVPLVVANDGETDWSADAGFALAYHWLDRTGEVVVRDGRRTTLPETVPAAGEIAVIVSLEAPATAGEYLLQWDVVREGHFWVSRDDSTPVDPIPVVVYTGHAFSLIGGRSPRLIVGDGDAVARLRVRNDGRRSWAADGSFAFSYHWLDGEGEVVQWDGRRTTVPHPVGAGETVDLDVVIEPPPQAGFLRLQWDMVEEGVCWFSERMPGPIATYRVTVVPDIFRFPALWAVAVLMAAAIVAVAGSREGAVQRWGALLAASDLVWLCGSLVFKQAVVLSEAGLHPAFSGWMLMSGTAAGAALLVLWVGERWRPWVCWTAAALATALLYGDALYIRFFNDLPGAGQIAAVGQIGSVEASIFSLTRVADIWLWLDLLPGFVLVLSSRKLRRRVGQSSRRIAALVFAGVAVAACVVGAGLVLKNSGILSQVFRRALVAREIGVINQQVLDLGGSLVESVSGSELDPEEYEQVVDWFSERSASRSGAGPYFAAAAGLNVVMIQVESLQGFVIGLEIGGREVTPFLNRWAGEALWFSNVTDQTRHGRSSDAELATQASLLPAAGTAAAFRFGTNDFTGLAEVLARSGYSTMSAVPYDGSFWNRRVTHEAYGYAESLFVEDFGAGESVGWGLSDREFLVQAADRLAAAERPFAAYLLTLSLHHPFEGFPRHLEDLDVGEWDGTPYGNFLHTMHFFDASLAAFVEALESRNLADSTVIAIWGDHDAGFDWRREIAAEMGVVYSAVGWYLSQEVPLFIRVPGAGDELRGERLQTGGHVDVAPTLLALLGVDPQPYAFVGRNLLGTPSDVPVVGEYGCWRTSELLFLASDGSSGHDRCLDIGNLKQLAVQECGDGRVAARLTEAMSERVLEHDLQRRIHVDLSVGAGGAE